MPIRLVYLQINDLTGPDASATVQLIDRDDLDRDSPPQNLTVPLKPDEKHAMRDVLQRAKAKMQRRLDKARADRQADAAAPINLSVPVEGEDDALAPAE